jgi:hypothetical protein
LGRALRILLSFNPNDLALAEALRASLFVVSPDPEVFFSPTLFEDDRALDLQHADAFLLLIGPHGLVERQAQECRAAIEISERNKEFIVVSILAAGAQSPQFLPCKLTCIKAPVVTDRKMLHEIIAAINQFGGLKNKSGSKGSIYSLLRAR